MTLRAVARRVGIAAPSVYGHFPDRESILLATVQQACVELTEQLHATQTAAGTDPVRRLRAVSAGYLGFAEGRPQRYRVMFGGVWDAADSVRAVAVGHDALTVIVGALQDCAAVGVSSSTDPVGDAVALWVALHGLAHQCAVIPHFPWPGDTADRLGQRLALLPPDVTIARAAALPVEKPDSPRPDLTPTPPWPALACSESGRRAGPTQGVHELPRRHRKRNSWRRRPCRQLTVAHAS